MHTPKDIYFSELKNLGGGPAVLAVCHMPRAYISLYYPIKLRKSRTIDTVLNITCPKIHYENIVSSNGKHFISSFNDTFREIMYFSFGSPLSAEPKTCNVKVKE